MIRLNVSRLRWLRVAGSLAGGLGLLAACALLGLALRGRELRPRELHLHTGRIHLVGFTAYPYRGPLAACISPPYRCVGQPARPTYTLWLVDVGPGRLLSDSIWNICRIPLSLDQLAESLST